MKRAKKIAKKKKHFSYNPERHSNGEGFTVSLSHRQIRYVKQK
jgi:hypothetical protein